MPEEIVYEPALVECVGPEHHRFTTAEDVKQLAHYVAGHDAPIGFYYPKRVLGRREVP
jgi:hypothetical protein